MYEGFCREEEERLSDALRRIAELEAENRRLRDIVNRLADWEQGKLATIISELFKIHDAALEAADET